METVLIICTSIAMLSMAVGILYVVYEDWSWRHR